MLAAGGIAHCHCGVAATHQIVLFGAIAAGQVQWIANDGILKVGQAFFGERLFVMGLTQYFHEPTAFIVRRHFLFDQEALIGFRQICPADSPVQQLVVPSTFARIMYLGEQVILQVAFDGWRAPNNGIESSERAKAVVGDSPFGAAHRSGGNDELFRIQQITTGSRVDLETFERSGGAAAREAEAGKTEAK